MAKPLATPSFEKYFGWLNLCENSNVQRCKRNKNQAAINHSVYDDANLKHCWQSNILPNRCVLALFINHRSKDDKAYLPRHGHVIFLLLRMCDVFHGVNSMGKRHHIPRHPSPVASVMPWRTRNLYGHGT
jgi:hypothetical protein